jgi:hypothetical protein
MEALFSILKRIANNEKQIQSVRNVKERPGLADGDRSKKYRSTL